MIATIATVTLAASAAANPTEGQSYFSVSDLQACMYFGGTGSVPTNHDLSLHTGTSALCIPETKPEYCNPIAWAGLKAALGTSVGRRELDGVKACNSPEGRQLIGYTESLGESCDMVTDCKSGLKCTNDGMFGTGKCIEEPSENTSHEWVMSRKLYGYTQSLGEKCDMVSYCKGSGLTCDNGVFGTGKCIASQSALFKRDNFLA